MLPRLLLLLVLGLLPSCKRDTSAPGPGDVPAAPAAAPAAAAAQAVAIRPGDRIGPLRLGQSPPLGHDGARQAADGRVVYWSDQGLEAVLGPDGRVREAVAHGAGSDPFFRAVFKGKTAKGLGPGSTQAEVRATLGEPKPVPGAAVEASPAPPSPFYGDRRVLAYPALGLAFDVAGASGTVAAVRVTAPAR